MDILHVWQCVRKTGTKNMGLFCIVSCGLYIISLTKAWKGPGIYHQIIKCWWIIKIIHNGMCSILRLGKIGTSWRFLIISASPLVLSFCFCFHFEFGFVDLFAQRSHPWLLMRAHYCTNEHCALIGQDVNSLLPSWKLRNSHSFMTFV